MSTWLQTKMDIGTNSLRAVIAAWLNASQRSRNGVVMNRSARGWSAKRFEQSQGLDTALYKNVPLPFILNSNASCFGYVWHGFPGLLCLCFDCKVTSSHHFFTNEIKAQNSRYHGRDLHPLADHMTKLRNSQKVKLLSFLRFLFHFT